MTQSLNPSPADSTPPGWYQTVYGTTAWWNGTQWTDQTPATVEWHAVTTQETEQWDDSQWAIANEVQPEPKKRKWWTGLLLVFGVIPWLFAFVLFGTVIALLLALATQPDFDYDTFTTYAGLGFFGLLFQQIGMATWPLFAAKARNLDWKKDLGFEFERKDIAYGIAGMIVGYALALLGVYAVQLITGEAGEGNTQLITESAGYWKYGLAALATFGAPISEEIFFRGYLLKGALRHMPAWISIFLMTIIFTSIHYTGGGWEQLGTVFASLVGVSFVLNYLTYKTGRISASIIAHTLFNGTTVGILLFFT